MFDFEYEILDSGVPAGTARVTRDGLYWDVEAECAAGGERIVRVYASGGGRCVNLGVLMPEDGRLRLHRRVSGGVFCFDADTCLSTQRETDWAPFSGTVEGVELDDALRRGRRLAVPCEPEHPFALMEYFRRFRIEPVGGRPYWTAELDESGAHLAAAPEKEVDNSTNCDKIATASGI